MADDKEKELMAGHWCCFAVGIFFGVVTFLGNTTDLYNLTPSGDMFCALGCFVFIAGPTCAGKDEL